MEPHSHASAFFAAQPMEGRGAEMDMVSGYPAELGREARGSRASQHQHDREARVWRLLNDLQGPGSEIAQRLLTKAVDRMHELCGTDPQLAMLFEALGDAVFAEMRQSNQFARESALQYCAMLLRVPLRSVFPVAQDPDEKKGP